MAFNMGIIILICWVSWEFSWDNIWVLLVKGKAIELGGDVNENDR